MIPDELVTAAAEALNRQLTPGADPTQWEETARIALAPAFAKMADCQEAKRLLVNALAAGYTLEHRPTYTEVKTALDALAKWGQPSSEPPLVRCNVLGHPTDEHVCPPLRGTWEGP